MCFFLQGSSSINCKPTFLIFKLRSVVKCVSPCKKSGGDRVILNCLHLQRLHTEVCASAASCDCCDFWRCVITIWCSCGRLLPLLVILKTSLVLQETLPSTVCSEFWRLNLPCAALACYCSCQTFTVGTWTVAGSSMGVQDSLLTPDLE